MTCEIVEEVLPAGISLLRINGRLDHNSVPELEVALRRLVDMGNYRLVVDLQGTTYINSGGLRVLITIWRTVRRLGGDMYLCGLNRRLSDIFEMAGFDQVFSIYVTVPEAVHAMTV